MLSLLFLLWQLVVDVRVEQEIASRRCLKSMADRRVCRIKAEGVQLVYIDSLVGPWALVPHMFRVQ